MSLRQGDVWLALLTKTNSNVAVKKLKAERVEKHMLRKFRDEPVGFLQSTVSD